jgi:hypothetical protein
LTAGNKRLLGKGIKETPMLASDLRPLTAANHYLAETEPRPLLVIEGVVFRPVTDDRNRPVWIGGNGRTITISRLDEIMDNEIDVSYIPSLSTVTE